MPNCIWYGMEIFIRVIFDYVPYYLHHFFLLLIASHTQMQWINLLFRRILLKKMEIQHTMNVRDIFSVDPFRSCSSHLWICSNFAIVDLKRPRISWKTIFFFCCENREFIEAVSADNGVILIYSYIRICSRLRPHSTSEQTQSFFLSSVRTRSTTNTRNFECISLLLWLTQLMFSPQYIPNNMCEHCKYSCCALHLPANLCESSEQQMVDKAIFNFAIGNRNQSNSFDFHGHGSTW